MKNIRINVQPPVPGTPKEWQGEGLPSKNSIFIATLQFEIASV